MPAWNARRHASSTQARGHHAASRGQVLALFAILVPGMLAFMGLGLDGARVMLERRDVQGAADLAALVGSASLPTDAAKARLDAVAIAVANGFPAADVTVVTPYGGDVSRIEVTIRSGVRTAFLPVLGLILGGDHSWIGVDGRAVAKSTVTVGSGGGYAIYALRATCTGEGYKTIDWSGSTVQVTGKVHSESGTLMGGSSNRITGATTYECNGLFQNGGGGNVFLPPAAAQANDPPVSHAYTSYNNTLPGTCTFTGPASDVWDLSTSGPWWIGGNKGSKLLQPGVYCTRASGDKAVIKLSDQGISGVVTFVAGHSVEISGSDFMLSPFRDGILMFSNGTTDVALKLSGSGGVWTGLLYAPRGLSEVSGSGNWSVSGGIVANRVKLNGSAFGITGTIGAAAGTTQRIALTE